MRFKSPFLFSRARCPHCGCDLGLFSAERHGERCHVPREGVHVCPSPAQDVHERFVAPSRQHVQQRLLTHCPIDLAEIAGLKRASVDLDARLLRGACKCGGAHEDVPFNDVVAEVLEAWVAERDLLPADSDSLLLSGELVPRSVQTAHDVVSAAGWARGRAKGSGAFTSGHSS